MSGEVRVERGSVSVVVVSVDGRSISGWWCVDREGKKRTVAGGEGYAIEPASSRRCWGRIGRT
jgi:hypothetical protein